MWTKSHTIVTTKATKEQMWKLFENVNEWPTWDNGIEETRLEGKFEAGNQFMLKPKGGPRLTVKLTEAVKNQKFTDVTSFPLAKLYDEHIFEETPEGLKVTNKLTMKGLLSFVWIKLVAANMAKSLPQDMLAQIDAASALQSEKVSNAISSDLN
ncbi:SRPBCC family protein [Chitinophagaceae bacterium 26-R-25]|nr:SRPBCC family protein [Chitinophagaceae bacterium 26-R-25]